MNYLIFFIDLILLLLFLKLLNYKERKVLGYYVFCPQADPPKYIHNSYASAYKKARRLHRKHPYSDFQILKIEHHIMGRFIEDDEIPF